MSEVLGEKISRWSLDRVRFLLAHIESFVDDEHEALRSRARQFTPASGLDQIERLVDADPSDSKLARLCFERLSAFFDSGLLLQHGPQADGHWWVTDLFGRGTTFQLQMQDQVLAPELIPEITPLQVHRTDADRLLSALNLRFLLPARGADAYLLRPAPNVAYVLIANLGAPFAVDHIAHAHRLISKAFLY